MQGEIITKDACPHPEIRYMQAAYSMAYTYRCALCGKGVDIPMKTLMAQRGNAEELRYNIRQILFATFGPAVDLMK